ncbi:MAG: hypothetical protein KME17_07105 [Cyanosarcina radialis HA8281-LM2]|jgi:flagellar biosynthesis component FlhA|nr:hypothetical protein [Cyanosarcina radialis HA8281-LM2]
MNRNNTSLDREAKAGLSSLLQQTAVVFIGFLVILLLSRGSPSPFIVGLSFVLGTIYVAWSEKRRIHKSRQLLTKLPKLTTAATNEQTKDIEYLAKVPISSILISISNPVKNIFKSKDNEDSYRSDGTGRSRFKN